jgi:hypothetical protein
MLSYHIFIVNRLNTAFLISSIAFAVNSYAQDATDNSNSARQTLTIEDRLAQLQQDQQGLAGRVDALSKRFASLQQEIKTLEDQTGGLSGSSSNGPKSQPDEAPNDDSANATSGASVASYDVFYDRLQSDGQWFNDSTYGSVWQPTIASSDTNWRPYTDGHWVYSDRGWTWISNENFGWATYHYGRWARLSDKGWVWVPGSTWAPAWVSWRESDDYVGWAPLPPEAQSRQNVKIEGWTDNYYNIGPASYVFLKTTDLANRSYRSFIVSSQENVDVISRTKNVTNIFYDKTGVIDNGPDYDRLTQDSNVKIDRYKLNFVQQNNPGTQFGASTHGNQLQFVAPGSRLQRAATVQPKIAGNIAKTQVDRGWQDIDQTRANQLRQTWETQAPVPPGLPANPAPPKPLFARMTGQGQGTNQQPSTETRQPNSPSSNQRSNNESNAAPTASPSPNEKQGPASQQAPTPSENKRQELNQGERPETTPPAPSPSENEKSLPQRENEAVRRLRNTDEAAPAKGERQQEGDQNSEKSKAGETERATSGDRNGRSRERSDKEKPADSKRSDQPEKQKVEPSRQ